IKYFLLIIDSFYNVQKNDSFYYMNYRFKCIFNCVINEDNLDNKKRTVAFFNIFYLILSFIIFSSRIFILGSIIYNKEIRKLKYGDPKDKILLIEEVLTHFNIFKRIISIKRIPIIN
ncbi:MAG: hypothetical protein ACI35S_09005, partial [Anaeroplasma sp.]